MASTGNIYPGTGENNAGRTGTAWSNPENITADDGSNATCGPTNNTQYLVARNFGFAIPAGATIDGVTVRIEASESSSGTDVLAAHLQDETGALTGGVKTTGNVTTLAVHTLGGTADVWGATLTPAIVNDADFGVRIWGASPAGDWIVDYVTIAIEYTGGSTTVTGDLDATETGSDTLAATGSVTLPACTSSFRLLESGDDRLHEDGGLRVLESFTGPCGTMSAVESGGDTFAATGTSAGPVPEQPTIRPRAGGGGYLVELDAKPKREIITLYNEDAEILEILAIVMPLIQQQNAMGCGTGKA
jgi:hypothetical protein